MKRLCNYSLAMAIAIIVELVLSICFFVRFDSTLCICYNVVNILQVVFLIWLAKMLPWKTYKPIVIGLYITGIVLCICICICIIEIQPLIFQAIEYYSEYYDDYYDIFRAICPAFGDSDIVQWSIFDSTIKITVSLTWIAAIVVWVLMSRIFSGKIKIISIFCIIFVSLYGIMFEVFKIFDYSDLYHWLIQIFNNLYLLATAAFYYTFYQLKKNFNNGT